MPDRISTAEVVAESIVRASAELGGSGAPIDIGFDQLRYTFGGEPAPVTKYIAVRQHEELRRLLALQGLRLCFVAADGLGVEPIAQIPLFGDRS